MNYYNVDLRSGKVTMAAMQTGQRRAYATGSGAPVGLSLTRENSQNSNNGSGSTTLQYLEDDEDAVLEEEEKRHRRKRGKHEHRKLKRVTSQKAIAPSYRSNAREDASPLAGYFLPRIDG